MLKIFMHVIDDAGDRHYINMTRIDRIQPPHGDDPNWQISVPDLWITAPPDKNPGMQAVVDAFLLCAPTVDPATAVDGPNAESNG